MPSALQATASLATQPEKASTGFHIFGNLGNTDGSFSHNRLTVKAAFPGDHDICIPDIFSRWVSSRMILIPDSSVALQKVRKANPIPPAAPAPGYLASA